MCTTLLELSWILQLIRLYPACDASRENSGDEESVFCMVHISFNDGNIIQSNFLGRVAFEALLS